MAKRKNERDFYALSTYSEPDLVQMHQSIQDHAIAIDGMPQSASEAKEKRGWMLPFLFAYDELLWGRWNYWTEILMKNTIEGSGPIPKIQWTNDHEAVLHVKKMFRKVLDHYDSDIYKFGEWVLWAMGQQDFPTNVTNELHAHYYKHFDLFLVLKYPTDYLSYVLTEETGRGYKEGLGYFPTPFNVTTMMAEMAYGMGDPEEKKRQTVNDPCVGCGAMLLPASNYSLRGYGQDISRVAVLLCKVQMFWYAPWYAIHPEEIEGFEKTVQKELELVGA